MPGRTGSAGATIIPVHCEPLLGGRYRIVFHPPDRISRRRDVPGNGAGLLGPVRAVVRANPAPWLWMYKHWRYRPVGRGPGGLSFLRQYLPGCSSDAWTEEAGLLR